MTLILTPCKPNTISDLTNFSDTSWRQIETTSVNVAQKTLFNNNYTRLWNVNRSRNLHDLFTFSFLQLNALLLVRKHLQLLSASVTLDGQVLKRQQWPAYLPTPYTRNSNNSFSNSNYLGPNSRNVCIRNKICCG